MDCVSLDRERERKDDAADELQNFMKSIHAEEETEVSRPNKRYIYCFVRLYTFVCRIWILTSPSTYIWTQNQG
jgi:hypothetical protein